RPSGVRRYDSRSCRRSRSTAPSDERPRPPGRRQPAAPPPNPARRARDRARERAAVRTCAGSCGGYSCEVHCGHRFALMEIVEAQYGHSRVLADAAGAGLSTELLMRLTCLTRRKTAAATIRKLTTSFISWP